MFCGYFQKLRIGKTSNRAKALYLRPLKNSFFDENRRRGRYRSGRLKNASNTG
jgi:hypothetical protein